MMLPKQDNQRPQPTHKDTHHSQFPSEVRKKIQNYSFLLTDRIGKGYSSIVYRGVNDLTGSEVAIKVIELRSLRDQTSKHMLQTEIQCFKETKHPHLLRYENSFFTLNNCYIVTEFCAKGDLSKMIREKGGIPQHQASILFLQIFKGYEHFLAAGFIHRDLKPANIFVTADGSLKIADFGFSKRRTLAQRDNYNVGTPIYMPKESLTNNIYNEKTDVWALGITLYEMIFGCVPFRGQTEPQLRAQIEKGQLVFPDNRPISEDLRHFIGSCLHPDAFRRISVRQMPHHPWLRKLIKETQGVNITEPEGQMIRTQQEEKEMRISLPNDGVIHNKSKDYFQKPGLLENRRSISSMQKLKLCHPKKGSQTNLPFRVPLVNRSVGAINLTVPHSKQHRKHRENSQNKQNQSINKQNDSSNKQNMPTNRASVSLSTMPSSQGVKEGKERRLQRGIQKIVSLINYFRLLFKIIEKVEQAAKDVLDTEIRGHLTQLHVILVNDLRRNFQIHLDSLASGNNLFSLNARFWQQFMGSDRWTMYNFVIKRYQAKYDLIFKSQTEVIELQSWFKYFLDFYARMKEFQNNKVLLVKQRYMLCEVAYLLQTLVEMEEIVLKNGWDQFTEKYCGNQEFVPEGFNISMANYYQVEQCVRQRYSRLYQTLSR